MTRLAARPRAAAVRGNGAHPTEEQFRGQVLDLAQLLGWATYWTWNSIHSPAGFPDLVLCRPPRIIFVELKGYEKSGRLGQPSPEQQEWLEMLDASLQEWLLAFPEDLERIAEVLR